MLRFPRLSENCVEVSVCSRVRTTDKRLVTWLAKENFAIAKSGSLFVAMFTAEGKANHFHIDIRTAETFERRPPKPPNKLQEIRKAFSRISGCDADLTISAGFEILPSQFPEIMKLTRVGAEAGDVRMKVTGATVSVTGAPIYEVRWNMKEDATKARISMSAKRTVQLDDVYLVDSFELMRDAFQAIVLGE